MSTRLNDTNTERAGFIQIIKLLQAIKYVIGLSALREIGHRYSYLFGPGALPFRAFYLFHNLRHKRKILYLFL